jgi:hypothetical protein
VGPLCGYLVLRMHCTFPARPPAFTVADVLVQIYEIAGGGLLFGYIGTHILADTAELCGGAPADWIAYFASIADQLRPRGVRVSYSCCILLMPVPRSLYSRSSGHPLGHEGGVPTERGADGGGFAQVSRVSAAYACYRSDRASSRNGSTAGSILGQHRLDDDAQ